MIRILVVLVSIILFFLILIIVALAVVSPGKPRPLFDEKENRPPGSISEKISFEINGVKQGMFIRGRDTRNPVLLYLHGGMPEYFFTSRYPKGLENLFTVVWWEQRGSGLSYDSNMSIGSITLEQIIADTKETTQYLIQRVGKEKIYLRRHIHRHPCG